MSESCIDAVLRSEFQQRPMWGIAVKRGLVLSLLMLGAICLGGCDRPVAPGPQSGTSARPKIALIMKSLANEFFQTMAAGAKKHQTEHAAEYELIVNGIKNETDLAEQVGLVEQMMAQGVQAIVIAPADSKALIPILKRAQEAGILIINIDNQLDSQTRTEAGLTVPFVGPDNRDGAKRVGEVLAKELKAGDEVAIIEGVTTAFNGQQRKAGFEEAMNAAGMKIVNSQSGQWEMEKASTIAAGMLTAHPNLKAILCANDSMALGAVAAVETAGRSGQVKIVGFDHISAVQPLLQDGRILATADQHGDQLAVFGIQAALKLLKEKTAPADQQTPVEVITKGP